MLTIDQLNAVEAVDSANCRLRGRVAVPPLVDSQ